MTSFPNGKSAKLQVYGQSQKRCRELVAHYGGKCLKSQPAAWIKKASQPIVLPFPPHLCVVSEGHPPRPHHKLPRLLIPAGMAFGSGDHATTGMCLRQTPQNAAPPRSRKKRLLDLGTGSGILALAAALHGHEVIGLDFDPESIRTARENLRQNPVPGKVRWVRADLNSWTPTQGPYDLITANLFSNLLIQNLPRIKEWLQPQGEIILSGILKTQWPEVLTTLNQLKLQPQHILKKGKWVCAVLCHSGQLKSSQQKLPRPR
ncbi:MAG: methyltransferase domain-containing protein [Blastochloris sp.]|nr:methyltransferase domain-containing protein [Blastochloris sp.]